MFRNVLLITMRNMRRYKLYSAINIAGLSVGIACCLMIGLLIEDELRFDRFHENAKRIYRFSTWNNAFTHGHLGPRLFADFPEVEHAVRIAHVSSEGTPMAYQNREFFEEELLYATPDFFDVFSFTLAQGNPGTALAQPDAIVISQDMAKRYFGDADPMGRRLNMHVGYRSETTVHVTGVLNELSSQSHFSFQGLVPYAANSSGEREFSIAYTYLLLGGGANPGELIEKIHAWLPDQFKPNESEERPQSPASRTSRPFRLTPLTDIHLHSQLEYELGANRDINELYIFGTVGILVVLIACANYMNMATARSANRAREVGVRKVMGAHRRQLIQQLLGDAVISAVIAFGVAVMFTEMSLPILNAAVNRSLAISYSGRFFCTLGVGALVVGILAGSYPAFFLTRFSPTAMMKGLSRATPASAGLRKGLVVCQIAISLSLICTTAVVIRQLDFIKDKNLGFQGRDVVLLDIGGVEYDLSSVENRFQTIKNELKRNPNVLSVSLATNVPGNDRWGGGTYTLMDAPVSKTKRIKTTYIDQDYLETLGIELIGGQNLTAIFANRSYDGVILNESAAREMGIGRKTGQKVQMHWGDDIKNGTIVGIVKDFHLRSLHHEIEPLALRLNMDPRYVWHGQDLVVKLRPDTFQETLPFLRAKYAELVPSQHFRYTDLETFFNFDQLYQKETRLMRVFGTFSGLAIFVAFLGLFGLASYTAESRTREIGIRKVAGASVTSVVALVSKDFVVLVIIAIVIAWPVAYFGAESWLQNFAYRVDVGWWTFALTGASALGVALATVGWQARRAARTNPVDVLRHE